MLCRILTLMFQEHEQSNSDAATPSRKNLDTAWRLVRQELRMAFLERADQTNSEATQLGAEAVWCFVLFVWLGWGLD